MLWQWFIKPSAHLKTTQDRRLAEVLSSILILLLPLGVYFALLPDLINGPGSLFAHSDSVISLSILLLLAGAYVLSRTRHYRVAARLTVWGMAASIFLSAIPETAADTGDTTLLLYLVLPVTISSILLSLRETVLLIAVNTAGMVSFPYLFESVTSDDIWLGFVSIFSITILVATSYIQKLEHARQQQVEQALRRRDVILKTLAHISEQLFHSQDLDLTLPALLAELGQAINVSRVYVFQNHTAPDGTQLASQHYEWTAPSFEPQISNPALQQFAYTTGGFSNWLDMGKGAAIQGITRTMPPRQRDFLERQSILALAVVPIFVGSEWWGFLGFDDCVQERDWTAAELDALRSVAGTLGAAIVQQHSRTAEREQRALSDALRDTTALLNRTLELDQVLEDILTHIERVVPHDAANIMLFEDDRVRTARSRGYGPYGIRAWMETLDLPLAERPRLFQVIETGRGYRVTDTLDDPDWVFHPETAWIRSHVCAPIRIEGRVLGVINLDSDAPGTFSDRDGERLQAFADQASIAVQNARLYDELERRVRERTVDLSVRNAVAETLSSSLDMDEMLNGVLRTTVEQLGVLGGAIYLLTPDVSRLDMVAHYGVPAEALNLLTGITDRPGSIQTINQIPGETGISALLTVPIWRHEQILGVIALAHNQPRPWRSDETSMIDAIGRQIGMALTNARLYADALRDEAQIRTILQSVGDGLLMLDHTHTPILMNTAAEKLFAFFPADQGGAQQAARYLWDWLQTQDDSPTGPGSIEFDLPLGPTALAQCTVQQCPQFDQPHTTWPCWLMPEYLARNHPPDCTLYDRIPRCAIRAHTSEIRNAGGDVLGTVIALHDVTYYHEVDTLKERFVSTVSHELRTPLSAMLLQVSTLLKYYDRIEDKERREVLHEIAQQGHDLHELVEDILELSRFDARRSRPQKQWFDLAAQCHDMIAMMHVMLAEKHLEADLSGCPPHCMVSGDSSQLTRALRNLVSNAIKYTPEYGRITLSLACEPDHVHLSIADTGIGISPDDQPYIFDRFFRTEDALRMASGTGLGLAITREIIELHGGQIALESSIGQGSTFTLTLPRPTE